MIKNLVTGASGFIGSNLVEALLNKNQQIIGMDKDYKAMHRLENIIPKHINTYYYSSNVVSKNFTMVWDNINNISSYQFVLDDVDTVYHLAAAADIKKSLEDTTWDFENNVLGTFNILEMMRKKDINKIVFPSTSAIYGETPIVPTDEENPLIPVSLYTMSKICGEYLVKAYNEVYGIKGWIFRFGNVVGKNQHRGVICDFIQKLKKDKKVLEILGDGKQIKSYVHVSDIVNAMLEIPSKDKNQNVTTYNIATYDWIDVTTLADILCDRLELNPKYKYTGGDRGWKGDIPKIQLSIQKALKTGWKPKYSCEESIRKAIRELIK